MEWNVTQTKPNLQEVTEAFERESQAFAAVVSKAIQAYKASEAAKKARELVRRKNVLVKSTLPGKLADCSGSDVSQSEIFIVEGDSAGKLSWQSRLIGKGGRLHSHFGRGDLAGELVLEA